MRTHSPDANKTKHTPT